MCKDLGFIFYEVLLKMANYLICLHDHRRHFCGYIKVVKIIHNPWIVKTTTVTFHLF